MEQAISASEFIKKNLGTFVAITIVLFPSIWGILQFYYAGRFQDHASEIRIFESRIQNYELRLQQLTEINEELEKKSTGFKELVTQENVINWSEIQSN